MVKYNFVIFSTTAQIDWMITTLQPSEGEMADALQTVTK